MCNRLTKLSVTMWYTFFGKFHGTSLWILHEMHDASLCDAPDDIKYLIKKSIFVVNLTLKLFPANFELLTKKSGF